MAPETLAFLSALLSWTMTPDKLGDRLEGLGGTRDSGIPPFASVDLKATPTAGSDDKTDGLRVKALLPQAIKEGSDPVPLTAFDFAEWPLTFAFHNAKLTANSGSEATVDQWVAYAATGSWQPSVPGTYTFTVTFRAPVESGCYAVLVIGGEEVFPGFERRFRKKIPPRIVMVPGERRTFQRAVTVATPGAYALDLAAGCYPGRKPAIRVAEEVRAAWQATEINLQITSPDGQGPRAFEAGELVIAP